MTIWTFYHAAAIAMLLVVLAHLSLNLCFFRSLRAPVPERLGGSPLVSILVPARNEARRVVACVESLLAQNYPRFELLVLDDNSEDETAGLLLELGLRDDGKANHRMLRGAPLPPGWTGKCWACQQLAQAARGDFFFFTDADTIHTPATLAAAVSFAQETRADLLSAWPRLITKTWSEKLVIPVLHILAVALFPLALITFFQRHPAMVRRIPRSVLRAFGGANGQFLFFKKNAYETIGGHTAVRGHLVEDVALGREIAERMGEGMRLVNCDASRLVECRMYESFREVWEGFTKNARPAFEEGLLAWWWVGLTQFGVFFLPFALLLFSSQRPAALVEIVLIYLLRALLTMRLRTSWLGCLLHPFGHALAMAIGINSWRLASRRGVTWKGRVYRTE